MRAHGLALFVVVVAACSGDTFQPAAAAPGAAGTTGTAGTDAGSAGNEAAGGGGGASTAGEGGTTAGTSAVGGAEAGGSDGAGATGGTNVTGGTSGAAGATVTGGTGGTAGNTAGGAAGGSAGQMAAGSAGAAGGCVTAKPTPPKKQECGNGVVEGTEACDDGLTSSGDGCSEDCKLECEGVVVEGHCYALVGANIKAEDIYLGPTMPNQVEDLVRPKWSADPCAKTGVVSHLLILETEAEHLKLLASSEFMNVVAPKIQVIGAYVGAGARFRDDQPLTNLETWRNGEGGAFPGQWVGGKPLGGGRCAVMEKSGLFTTAKCFLLADISATRDVVCEREQACAIEDGNTAHVGYLGANKHCYARFATPSDLPVPRAEAEATCAAAGAHLVAFENLAELNDLTGADLTSERVWTAGTKLACAGDDKLRWSTDASALNYGGAFWSDGEPQLGSGDCVIVGRNRRFAVASCESKAGVLCERDY